MTDFLLALAFVMTLLFGCWIMSRLDRFMNSFDNDATAQSTLNNAQSVRPQEAATMASEEETPGK